MRLSRGLADSVPGLVAVVVFWQLLGPVRQWGGQVAVVVLATVVALAALSVSDRLDDRRRAGVSLTEATELIRRARDGDLPADPDRRRRMATLVDRRWQRRRVAVTILLVGLAAIVLMLTFRTPPLDELEVLSAASGFLLAVLLVGFGQARGLRRARVAVDPEIQALAAEERRSGSRGGRAGSEGG